MTNPFIKKFGFIINTFLHPVGLHVSRYPIGPSSNVSFEAMLNRLAKRTISVNTIIDVGASDGRWSRRIETVYPDAKYLLLEANEVHEPALAKFISTRENAEYTLAVVADRLGEIYFDDSNPMGGLASFEPTDSCERTFKCTTVDSEVKSHDLKGPYLLKLDTHGFEIPIFEGAQQVLRKTSLIVIEVYNFNLTGKSLRFWEMCQYLEEVGFLPIDILDPMFRPKDGAFWQLDIVFARNSRREFASNSYR